MISGITSTLQQKDTGYVFQLFQVVRQLCTILFSIILVKSSMSISEVGNYELWLWIATLFASIWLQGVFVNLLTVYQNTNRQKVLIGSIFLLTTGVVIIYLFSILLPGGLLTFLSGQSSLPHSNVYAFSLFCYLSSLYLPYLLLVKKMKKQLLGYAIFYLMSFIIMAIFFLINPTSKGLALAFGTFSIFQYCFLLFVLLKTGLYFSFPLIKRFIIQAAPLILAAVIASMAQYFDEWYINQVFNDSSIFVQYRYGARELPLTLTLASSFANSMILPIQEDQEKALKRIKKTTKRWIVYFFLMAIPLILVSPLLFEFIYDKHFIISAFVFSTFLLILICRFLFPHAILLAKGERNTLLIISGIELGINILLTIWLLPKLGLIGVAIATVIAYLFEKIILILFLHLKYKIHLKTYIPIYLWLCASLVLIAVFLIQVIYLNPYDIF